MERQKSLMYLQGDWTERLQSYKFWKTTNRVVNELQLQGVNIFWETLLLSCQSVETWWLSFCFSEHQSQSLYDFNAQPRKRRKKHRNVIISEQVQNSTMSGILDRITLKHPCGKKYRKEILYIKLPALVECLLCDCYIVSNQKYLLNEWIARYQDLRSFSYCFCTYIFPKFLW